MSAQGSGSGSSGGKKAVHVKWAGKTIALGTFPAAEADEKCAKAKALTRAWRSTMRPKPSREWVMLELERLNVRQVSGRLGRKGTGEEGEEGADGDMARGAGGMDRNSSMGWGGDSDLNSLMQRRSSSLGFGMMDDDLKRRNSSMGLGVPPHRPLVGGGAAAAYEAARSDHYSNIANRKGLGEDGPTRASGMSLGMGGMGGGATVNPNQHYEMLKLHHMNLLNEIQETTLMMNLYQQQQLQQQQQQLQQQGSNGEPAVGVEGSHMPMMHMGMGGMGQQRPPSLGMGGPMSAVSGQMGDGGAMGGEMSDKQHELTESQKEQEVLEERLKKLKEDIARRQKEAEELEEAVKSDLGEKRKAEGGTEEPNKKMKAAEEEGDDDEKDEVGQESEV